MKKHRILISSSIISLALPLTIPPVMAQDSPSGIISFQKGSGDPTFEQITEGLTITEMGSITGRGLSEDAGFVSADLGIPISMSVPNEYALFFGDTFTGDKVGAGDWFSPVGALAQVEDGKMTIKTHLNDGDTVDSLVDYEHTNDLTLIPSDVINVDGDLYMHGKWNRGIGNVISTGIWKSTDAGQTWEQVSEKIPADFLGGKGQELTWEHGEDGYIYAMMSGFQRDKGVIQLRTTKDNIADPTKWERRGANDSEGNATWGVNVDPVEILSPADDVYAGEMSLRMIQGHWVLSMFNEITRTIEVRVTKDVDGDWRGIDSAHVVAAGQPTEWVGEQTYDNYSQLYGGYITPDSTLDNMKFLVSQWNTYEGAPYHVAQFNVEGLMEHFGIAEGELEPSAPPAAVNGYVPLAERGTSPTDPVDPTDTPTPTDPTETETPVEPTETETPVEPTETVTPVEPTETETPVEPTETETPVEPTETVTPVEPTETETPVEPTETDTPVEPTETLDPSEPTDTETQEPTPGSDQPSTPGDTGITDTEIITAPATPSSRPGAAGGSSNAPSPVSVPDGNSNVEQETPTQESVDSPPMLATTGANIVWLAIIGLVSIAGGIITFRRNRT